MSTVDELREEWLAKLEVAEGLSADEAKAAIYVADAVANGVIPQAQLVDEFRTARDRRRAASVSARHAQAAFDQARAAAVEVPA